MLVFLLACATQRLPEPTETMVTAAIAIHPEATLASLTQGRQLTLDHCAGCHRPPRPSATQDPGWAETLYVMQEKSELNDADTALIELYLRASLVQP